MEPADQERPAPAPGTSHTPGTPAASTGGSASGTSRSGTRGARRSSRGSRRSAQRSSRRGTWRGYTPEQLETRRAAVPAITYPAELPVSARREEIAQAIAHHQVVIVAGETGSGKTTQIPKICLELGRGVTGMIGHTQPRRLAARTVAERIAEELGTRIGREGVVGYQVRFTDEVGPTTLVKLMTDGILLAEIQNDPMLLHYDTIIVDEAHERSLNIDFILGYLARLLPQRPDLKVIITSATIDSERFAEHFGVHDRDGRLTHPAPVVEVSGRTYPVQIRYRPLVPDTETDDRTASSPADGTAALPSAPGDLSEAELDALTSPDPAVRASARARREAVRERSYAGSSLVPRDAGAHGHARGRSGSGSLPGDRAGDPIDQVTGILQACDELMSAGSGDILVFLAGERDIRDTEAALIEHLGPRYTPDGRARTAAAAAGVEVVPLYSRLSAPEQHRVFEPHTTRRIVLATNVAETSLTVPGIHYVVDPGLARISRYSNRTKVQRLPIEPVSQASANQRSGRCGRVADGIAIRLYSQRDLTSRPEYTEPEILRTSLASVILQMAALGLGDVADFPFLDAPDHRAVRDGIQLLQEIGAIETGTADRSVSRADDGATASGSTSRTPRAGDADGDPGAAPSGNGRGSRQGRPPRSGRRGPRLTPVGRRLARLPIDPRLGRMLLEAKEEGCAGEVMVIVAALSIQDVRERPADHQEASDALHRRFADPTSDFLTYLNLWRYLRTQQRELSGSAFRRMCRAEFLHYLRVREWQDVHTQLRQLARPLGLDARPVELPSARSIRAAGDALEPGTQAATVAHGSVAAAVVALGRSADTPDADAIHRSLLVGLLSNVGNWDERRREYAGARGTRFTVWPGSGLRRKTYEWVMTAELVETSRLFARTVARVDPAWVEAAAGRAGLLKRSYGEPYWSTRQGAAMVHEKVLLYGMTLAADRPATLAGVGTPSAREVAREMFLREGLVEGGWHARHGFVEHNRALVEDLEDVERRRRTRGLLADDSVLYDFYDDRVPDDVTSAAAFDAWWKKERHEHPDLLDFTRELLLPGGDDASGFPDSWRQGDLTLRLEYVFEPGRHDDGVSLQVPVEVLGRVRPEGLEWLVPGMRPELCVATIRALPKRVRRRLVPAPDVGARVWEQICLDHPQARGGAEPAGGANPAAPGGSGPADGDPGPGPGSGPGPGPGPGSAPVPDDAGQRATSAGAGRRGQAAASAPEVSFQDAFSQAVRRLRDVEIEDEDWQVAQENLPDHLRMSVVALDGRGTVLGRSTDVVALARRLSGKTEAAVRSAVRGAVAAAFEEAEARAGQGRGGRRGRGRASRDGRGRGQEAHRSGREVPDRGGRATTPGTVPGTVPGTAVTTSGPGGAVRAGLAEKEGLTDWPSGVVGLLEGPEGRRDTLPATVESTGPAGLVVRGYPALVDTGPRQAALRILPDAVAQATAHAAGVRSLALARTALATGRVTSRWTAAESLALAASPYRSTDALVEDVQSAAARAVSHRWEEREGTSLARVRERAAFESLVGAVREGLEDEVYLVARRAAATLTAAREVDREVSRRTSLALLTTLQEVREAKAALVYDGFVASTPTEELQHLPRYLTALVRRLDAAEASPSRDAALAYQVRQAVDAVEAARARAAALPPDPGREAVLVQARWMVEELRVSLFAQTLGTPHKVSLKRIQKVLAQV